jgi:hypothetical protein
MVDVCSNDQFTINGALQLVAGRFMRVLINDGLEASFLILSMARKLYQCRSQYSTVKVKTQGAVSP